MNIPTTLQDFLNNIDVWADEKGILAANNPSAQAQKTLEEVNEMIASVEKKDPEQVKDDIGDILVTLQIQAKLQNTTLLECIAIAYNTIKNRTGKMIDGQFVKDNPTLF